MAADRFGIVNDPDDEDTAVLLYDGEPIGTIQRRQVGIPHVDGRIRFATAGLTVVSRFRPGVVKVERDATLEGTIEGRYSPEEYAAWKTRLGIPGDDA